MSELKKYYYGITDMLLPMIYYYVSRLSKIEGIWIVMGNCICVAVVEGIKITTGSSGAGGGGSGGNGRISSMRETTFPAKSFLCGCLVCWPSERITSTIKAWSVSNKLMHLARAFHCVNESVTLATMRCSTAFWPSFVGFPKTMGGTVFWS